MTRRKRDRQRRALNYARRTHHLSALESKDKIQPSGRILWLALLCAAEDKHQASSTGPWWGVPYDPYASYYEVQP